MNLRIFPLRLCFYRCVIAISLVSVLANSTAFCQAGLGDWKNVQSLAVGTQVTVKTVAKEKYFGRLVNVNDDSLLIDSDERRFPFGRASRRRTIQRAEVKEVHRRARMASMLLTGGIGAGIGAAIGGTIEASSKSNEDRGVALTVLTLLGFLIGTGIGRHTNIVKGKLVYVAAPAAPVSPVSKPSANQQR